MSRTTGLFRSSLLLLLLLACSAGQGGTATQPATGTEPDGFALPPEKTASAPGREAHPPIDLSITPRDVSITPLPLRAGFAFTITATIHNRAGIEAHDVPVMVHISPVQAQIGFSPYLEILTATVPATQPLSVQIPVHWNLAGGEHRLWLQVNRLPPAWQADVPLWPEERTGDNDVVIDLMVQPFDAYTSALCAGRVDVEIDADTVVAVAGERRVRVRVHNAGNQAVYHLPVIVLGDGLTGLAYTPAIPPCGGTIDLWVELDRTLKPNERLVVEVNPPGWTDGLAEDDLDNNRVTVVAALPGTTVPGETAAEAYDFAISAADIEIPQLWIVLVRVQNRGTRDAAMVPIRIENRSGRVITDAIPLVQGRGWGVAAIRVGYLWTPGGTLTFTVNPSGARGSYPESNRDDNVATFTLP